MKIDLGGKYLQAVCRKCGLNWIVAKGQKTNKYICPWCQSKRKGVRQCDRIRKC